MLSSKEAYNKMARILSVSTELLFDLERKMGKISGNKDVVEKIMTENDFLVSRTLQEFGVSGAGADADFVYKRLMERMIETEKHLLDSVYGRYAGASADMSEMISSTALELVRPKKGFFIKKDKMRNMLEQCPPGNIIKHFRCKGVSELLEKQKISYVLSALRFMQEDAWMHKFFDKAYSGLKPEDFEERDVEIISFDEQWTSAAEKFLRKKYHNVSHLKEYGIIFIIPMDSSAPGEIMRMFVLLLHYLNEVSFYSRLFRSFAKSGSFADSVKSLLRGDVPKGPVPNEGAITFRIVQRYLAKDNDNDFRLFEPHVNPEAEHWYKAEGDLGRMSELTGNPDLYGYWQGLDFVGGFFDGKEGSKRLVSFDLVDLIMSLVKMGNVKYLYHQEEALWNKIFIEYLGRDRINKLIEENIVRGFITL